ncbi:sigma-54 dependent transcriptional regulator [Celerinatantimonas sp. MCCC 1A17872]|uniref:sigma-54 dependent transcriptional regulator n=1 Tax=Celerinatantimonas sp. MCCC 1A17872 TaxID=3177514 RepID=UPI0038C664F6
MDLGTTILVCDSNQHRCDALLTVLQFIGEQSRCCQQDELSAVIAQSANPILIADGKLSQLSSLANENPLVPLMIIGAEVDESFHQRSNYLGVISEPFGYDQLTRLLHRAQTFLAQLPHPSKSAVKLSRDLVGKGIAMQEIRHLIDQVAHTNANVLILGESGTGKEVVARAVHEQSSRADGPFVPINCGAIPAELLESELFGHEKGAFTGAFSSRKGRFELSEGGTLFLDEIGDMPMPMQVKLLRVLQERVFERVGSSKIIKADVRIIAATHRNLESMITDGNFREDLFYRLNVFPIEVPSLRERSDDIPILLQELVARHAQQHEAMIRFTQRSVESLMLHGWPGNIRELSNLVERLVILHPNQIVDVGDLPPKYRHIDGDDFEPNVADLLTERDALMAMFSDDAESGEASAFASSFAGDENEPTIDASSLACRLPDEGLNLKDVLSEIEVDLIRQALDQQDGVVARAAEQLKMRRTTLVEKMKKYQLNKD